MKISMSKIESRPSKRKAWEYYFFADVDGHAADPALEEALAALPDTPFRAALVDAIAYVLDRRW